jgi:hypothetical protein
MQHRVNALRVAVHSPAGREGPALQLAERFVRQVLDQLGEIVEARSHGAVVLIRKIALKCSLSEAEMADATAAAKCAGDLADAVQAQGGMPPRATDTMAVFTDEATWLTAYLRGRAGGGGAEWFHAAWRETETHVGASPWRPETVVAALLRLSTTNELHNTLARLPRPTMATLVGALGIGARAAAGAAPGGALTRGAGAAPGRGLEAGPARADAKADIDGAGGWPEPDDDMGALARLSPEGVTDNGSTLIAAVAAALRMSGDGPFPPAAPASSGQEERGYVVSTRFGGLFYLMFLALELGIGESLWKACLKDGLILAHAAALLLGPDAAGDPAPAMFGGVTERELLEWPAVSPEQQAEVSVEILAAIAAALQRYGSPLRPEVVLDLAPSPAGRMLAGFSGPFSLFAWPAHDAVAVAAGLRTFLGAWSSSLPPPRARGVLLELDVSGRLQPLSGPVERRPLIACPGPKAPASALLAQICGAVAELFALRAGSAEGSAASFVSRYLAIPGRVDLAPGSMTIVLPMGAIDIAVRRAALDRDAGWAPWLRRTVRIEFAPDGEQEPI